MSSPASGQSRALAAGWLPFADLTSWMLLSDGAVTNTLPLTALAVSLVITNASERGVTPWRGWGTGFATQEVGIPKEQLSGTIRDKRGSHKAVSSLSAIEAVSEHKSKAPSATSSSSEPSELSPALAACPHLPPALAPRLGRLLLRADSQRLFNAATIAPEPRRVNDNRSGPGERSCLILAGSCLKRNLSNGAGSLDRCSWLFVWCHLCNSLIQSLYYTLFKLVSTCKPPRVLTHAIKTVFGMGLPSRNRGLGKGRAAKEIKKNKDTLY